jgi:threonine dehydrogenase-like Zn-dependent dehydrogenase
MVWPQTIRIIQEGLIDLESLITHKSSLEDTVSTIDALRNRVGNPIKAEVVLE